MTHRGAKDSLILLALLLTLIACADSSPRYVMHKEGILVCRLDTKTGEIVCAFIGSRTDDPQEVIPAGNYARMVSQIKERKQDELAGWEDYLREYEPDMYEELTKVPAPSND